MGTAFSRTSHVWFTLDLGVVTEVYYPTIDQPQLRDLQFLVTDGESFFHDERRDTVHQIEPLSTHALGYRITNADPEGRYCIVKEIIADPDRPTVLLHTSFQPAPGWEGKLRVFVLAAPHIEDGGWGNVGEVGEAADRTLLLAHKGNTWLALGASVPFARTSVGFVGVNDGWGDLATDFEMHHEYDFAGPGNIALTGEIDLSATTDFTLALSLGNRRQGAVTALLQSLSRPFAGTRDRYVAAWDTVCADSLDLSDVSTDGGRLFHTSQSLLLSHEDKMYEGAMIASLSIPWGETRNDTDADGYHLVWTRDMVNSSTGLLATGDTTQPFRALVYLAASQRPDGGFYQNFFVSGDPHWTGIQLDEVAFPIILAFRLYRLDALREFDPYPMVLRAARYLIQHGPATPQERWEEAAGYSPSTLASNIAALTCAAVMAAERGDATIARFITEYADFLDAHIEQWTVTTSGTLHPEVNRHYIRILPDDPESPVPHEDPEHTWLTLANRGPQQQHTFPAKDIIDAGFLELVRYGVRSAGDPLIEDSLAVVDHLLRDEFEEGPAWRRYNHDGYGQRADGTAYDGWGVGRAWPLLTGERAHYELAAGRPVKSYITAMERFARGAGLLPEQVWNADPIPEHFLWPGGPTGAAMPLMWAHAEYIKLLRSTRDDAVFDRIPEVAARYAAGRRDQVERQVWKPNRRCPTVPAGAILRVQAGASFSLVWTDNEWVDTYATPGADSELGVWFVDIDIDPAQQAPIRFTFHWGDGHWEGWDHAVEVIA